MVNKKIIMILSLSLLLVLVFTSAFAYYTNTYRYFYIDSKVSDGSGGYGTKRYANEFIDDGCGSGTILDTVTGLCWDKNFNRFGTANQATAISNCAGLSLGGSSNWRMPEISEIITLFNYVDAAGSTITDLGNFGFANVQSDRYWTNTNKDNNKFWYIMSNLGLIGSATDGNGLESHVCVRRP